MSSIINQPIMYCSSNEKFKPVEFTTIQPIGKVPILATPIVQLEGDLFCKLAKEVLHHKGLLSAVGGFFTKKFTSTVTQTPEDILLEDLKVELKYYRNTGERIKDKEIKKLYTNFFKRSRDIVNDFGECLEGVDQNGVHKKLDRVITQRRAKSQETLLQHYERHQQETNGTLFKIFHLDPNGPTSLKQIANTESLFKPLYATIKRIVADTFKKHDNNSKIDTPATAPRDKEKAAGPEGSN